ncbi:chromatin structure-remodeling complex protein RSC7, partial [Lecanoromycetidae sp. Uapishka_2]
MYSTSHQSIPASAPMNGMSGGLVDGSGTINPAALNTSDDQKPKKRGRPPKSKEDIASTTHVTQNPPDQLRTPQSQTSGLPLDPNSTPTQTSPPKPTPTKAAVVKALPTVRDHTTDQLTAEGDEFIPREHDEDGDRKVSPTGEPLGGRHFKMRTFYVANRGEKRFMLATECARVLNYRDSYLLFNKNRSLHKIIATQAEKDELIQQEILPYSYRSRQIAIVTAKSMFRQFGARVIEGGRRVRDDYWESKAVKQGFTEEDMAGDKRPGATKAREATAALENANNPINPAAYGQRPDVIYDSNATMQSPSHPHAEGPGYPTMTNIKVEDSRQLAYGTVPRPRHEITGAPYLDRTQPSPVTDVMHQAANAAELNKQLAAQRGPRVKYLDDTWNRERKTPISSPQQKMEQSPIVTQSPHLQSSAASNQQSLLQQQHQASQMMSPQSYSHQPPSHHQIPHAQSPVRSSIRPDMQQQQQHRSSISYTPTQHAPQTSPYGYPSQHQMWGHPPPHPQQSP